MRINPFLNRLMNVKKEDIFHNSGVVNNVSFSRRQEIDKNRSSIGSYRDSMIGQKSRPNFNEYKESQKNTTTIQAETISRASDTYNKNNNINRFNSRQIGNTGNGIRNMIANARERFGSAGINKKFGK